MRDGSCGMGVPPVQKGRAFWPTPQTYVNYLIRDPKHIINRICGRWLEDV